MEQKPQNYWQPETDQPLPSSPERPSASSAQTPPSVVSPALSENQEAPSPQLSKTSEEVELSDTLIEWQASEYIHHQKGLGWYVVLGVVTLAAAGVALLLQQWLFAALIIVMGLALGVYAKRQPHELHYALTLDGVRVDKQFFAYNQFRSFSVVTDGPLYYLQLRPVKRFMPAVSIYFAEEDGEQIVDVLAARIPLEDAKPDAVDKFMRWLRF